MLGPRKNRDYAPFGEGFVPPASSADDTNPAAAAAAAGDRKSSSTSGGGGDSGHAGRSSSSIVGAVDALSGGGGGATREVRYGGGSSGSLPLTVQPRAMPAMAAATTTTAAGGTNRAYGRVGGGSWALPPEPRHRRLREALCFLRMSPVQTLFLLGLWACLAFFSIDAWTQRRVLALLYQTLETVRPRTTLLTTACFAGMGLVFVALGFPTTLLSVLGGHVYGQLLGGYQGVLVSSLVTTASAGLGCLCSFLLTKGMLRDCASEWLHTRATLEGLDAALREEGLKVNLLLRLCPLVPYNIMNLLMGLTATRVEDYAIGCFVGMLPTVILLSYFGSGLDTLESIGDFSSSHRTEMRIIYGAGAGILLLTLASVYRSTRRAMVDAVKRKQSLVDSLGWEM